jgi:hypothetical protein
VAQPPKISLYQLHVEGDVLNKSKITNADSFGLKWQVRRCAAHRRPPRLTRPLRVCSASSGWRAG